MNKMKYLLLLFPLIFTSCNSSKINIPKSPFNDSYKRIGLTSEFPDLSITGLNDNEYQELLSTITDYQQDKKLYQYKSQEEVRDLKYAYFGKQDLTMSMCSLTSKFGTYSRYNNLITINDSTQKEQRQVSNGILNNNLYLKEYTVDTKETESKYYKTTESKKNEEPVVVISTKDKPTPYDQSTELDKVFGLTPYSKIKLHFDGVKDFSLLGEHAVYGKCNYENKECYIIKEGHSIFNPYTTAVGHTYKAVDNYFYETLLTKINEKLSFISFRFYTEKLILSESCESEGVPVVYLEKPVLVSFSETKYSDFKYEKIGDYTGSIPEPTL